MRYEVKEAIKTFKSCIDTLEQDKDMLMDLYNETIEQEKKVKSITGHSLSLSNYLLINMVNSYLNKKHFFTNVLDRAIDAGIDIREALDGLTYVPYDIDDFIKRLKEGISELVSLEKSRCKDVLSKDEINNIIAGLDRKELSSTIVNIALDERVWEGCVYAELDIKTGKIDVYFHADAELRPAKEEGIWIAWFRNDNLEELLPSESDLPDEIIEADDEVAAYLKAYSEELMNLDIIHFISQGALEMRLEEYEEDEEINKLLNEEQ